MEMRTSAESFKLGCEDVGDAVDSLLVIAGGFDFDEIANRGDDLVLMF